jgi:hypothetical protein
MTEWRQMGLFKWIKGLFGRPANLEEVDCPKKSFYSEDDLKKKVSFTLTCPQRYKLMLEEIVIMREEARFPPKDCTKSTIVSEAIEHLYCDAMLGRLNKRD